jgi:peptide/nickel transport system permease protein
MNTAVDEQNRSAGWMEWRRLGTRARLAGLLARLRSVEPLLVLGLLILIVLLFIAISCTWIAPYKPIYEDIANQLQAPSREHLFGTDHIGRDVFSRVLYGTRISLVMSVLVTSLVLALGVPSGLLAGYIGGRIDTIIMRLADLFFAFPPLVLALALATALGGGLTSALIAVGFASWPFYARLVRSVTLSVRQELYLEAARSIGGSDFHIISRHVLPNSIGPVLVQASMDIGWFLLYAASLSFIGIGAQEPTPEWGLMVSAGRKYIINQWWVSAFPGAAIFVTVLGFSLIGESLRDMLDPRLRRR